MHLIIRYLINYVFTGEFQLYWSVNLLNSFTCSLLIKLNQRINHSQPVTRIMLTIVIPINKRSISFRRYHMTNILPTQIIRSVNHAYVCIRECTFVVINYLTKLFPEITVLKRLDVFLYHPRHVSHMCRVQLYHIYVDLVCHHLHPLTPNFIHEVHKFSHILISFIHAAISKGVRQFLIEVPTNVTQPITYKKYSIRLECLYQQSGIIEEIIFLCKRICLSNHS